MELILKTFYISGIVLVSLQTFHIFQASAKVLPPSDVDVGESHLIPRQLLDEENIDTDGPYGYIPRVVHGVNKIVKGLLNGSIHQVFHGAFGIAPEDVADDLIGTYNQVMGIPDPDDLDLDETTEKGTGIKRKPAANRNKNKIRATKAPVVASQAVAVAPNSQAAVSNSNTKVKVKTPVKINAKEEDDLGAEEDEEDDD